MKKLCKLNKSFITNKLKQESRASYREQKIRKRFLKNMNQLTFIKEIRPSLNLFSVNRVKYRYPQE